MKLALAENLSLAEARWRLFQLRMRAGEAACEMADELRQGGVDRVDGRTDERPANRPHYWWQDQ